MTIHVQDLENNIQQTNLFNTIQVFMFAILCFKISQIFVTFVSMTSANNKITKFVSMLAELTPTHAQF